MSHDARKPSGELPPITRGRDKRGGGQKLPQGSLADADLITGLKLLLQARAISDILLETHGDEHATAAGHEGVQVAMASVLRPGIDWIFASPRDLALGLAHDVPPAAIFQAVRRFGTALAAFEVLERRVAAATAGVASAVMQAAGLATRAKRTGEDVCVCVSTGDRVAASGEFFEALNWASLHRAPLVIVQQANRRIGSKPARDTVAGGSAYELAAGFPRVQRMKVDGSRLSQLLQALRAAVRYAQLGKGPSLIEADVETLTSPSGTLDFLPSGRDPANHLCAEVLRRELATEAEIRAWQAEAAEVARESASVEQDVLTTPARSGSAPLIAQRREAGSDTSWRAQIETILDHQAGVCFTTGSCDAAAVTERKAALRWPDARQALAFAAGAARGAGFTVCWLDNESVEDGVLALQERSLMVPVSPAPGGGLLVAEGRWAALVASNSEVPVYCARYASDLWYAVEGARRSGRWACAILDGDAPLPDMEPPSSDPLRQVQPGNDVTVIAVGELVGAATEAAARSGISAAVFDHWILRPGLAPDAVAESVRATGRLLILDYADWRSGYAGQFLATQLSSIFEALDAPPAVLAVCRDEQAPEERLLRDIEEKMQQICGF